MKLKTEEDRINDEYFEWMYNLVYDDEYSPKLSYRKLLSYLHSKDFVYILPMDVNRAKDGMDLRYKFGREVGYGMPIIASNLDNRPCSILEMMVALAMRCEVSIMDDPDIGNRLGQWFWTMIINLNLNHMNDRRFDRKYVDRVLSIFLSRSYKRNGEGGLFTIHDPSRDMRSAEIWYQMCWYLDEFIEEQNDANS